MQEKSHKKLFLILGAIVVVASVLGLIYMKKPTTNVSEIQSIKGFITATKDCKTALPRVANFVRANPNEADGWYWQGYCLMKLGNTLAAAASFEKAVSLDRFSPAADYLKVLEPRIQAAEGKPVVNKQQYGPNSPEGFPKELVIKPISVLESYIILAKADEKTHTPARTKMYYKYTTSETKNNLLSAFSAYFKKEGYTVKSTVVGKGTILHANTKTMDKTCAINFGPNLEQKGKSETERMVDAICWFNTK